MKQSHLAYLALALASGWITGTNAWPTSLIPRSRNLADGILDLIEKVTGGDSDAWEWGDNPDMCLVWLSTYGGGGCQAKVGCDEGGGNYIENLYFDYQVCEIDKIQYWSDPRIGDFSVQYTDKDPGLYGPVLRFKALNDWEPLEVFDIAKPKDEGGAQVCYYGVDGERLWWGCGIPKLGKSGNGLESEVPVGQGGYATGSCEMHVVQHQKPDPSKDPYSLEVWIKDANQDDIGAVYPASEVEEGTQLKVDSKLPVPVKFEMGLVDADPITISYGKDEWKTDDDTRCQVGAYDGGMRQLDCDFDCR